MTGRSLELPKEEKSDVLLYRTVTPTATPLSRSGVSSLEVLHGINHGLLTARLLSIVDWLKFIVTKSRTLCIAGCIF